MKKVFYLKTCGTCKKIMSGLKLNSFEQRELKEENIQPAELEVLHELAGSYEALFSRRSQQIKLRNIDLKELGEEDYRELILSHYSFLKRPVFNIDGKLFVGSEKKTVEALKEVIETNGQ